MDIKKRFLIFPLLVFLICVILPHAVYSSPGVALTPTTTAIGKTVTFTGTGFSPSSIVTISFDGVTQPTTPSTVTTDGTGAFTATFTVPPSTAGPHTVAATDASANSASATLTVTLRATTTTVVPNPASTAIGAPMTFKAKIADTSGGTKIIPTGIVSWSDGGAGGSFSSASCTLAQFGTSTSTSICSVVYTPPANTGPVTITATYSGDSTHGISSGASTLTVTLRGTITVVTPNPATGTVGVPMIFKAKVTDSSGGTKTIPTGTVSWSDGGAGGIFTSPLPYVPGKIGQAISFDGISNVVAVPNSPTLNFGSTGSFSISLWMKTSQASALIVDKRPNNDGQYQGYSIELNSGLILGRVRDGSAHDVPVYSTTSVNDGNFHHVVYVVDRSTQTAKMYVDNNLQTSASISAVGSIDSSLNLVFGGQALPNTPVDFYAGVLDQIRMYSRALSPSDVQALFNEGASTLPTTALVGEWKFEGNTLDTSGNNNNGVLSGDAGVSFVPGKIGQALSFDGFGIDRVPDSSTLNFGSAGSFSISAWVKTSQSNIGWLVEHRPNNDGVYAGYSLEGIGTVGDVGGRIRDSSGHDVVVTTNPINDNQFHNIVFVVDRTTQTSKIYVDTILQASASIASVGNIDQEYIGVDMGSTDYPNTPNGPFVGMLDQVRIYSAALSSLDVQALFNEGGSSLPTAPLAAEWKFENNALDTSGNNNNGALSSSAPAGSSPNSCTLAQFGTSTGASTCSIKYNPPANAGPVTITATYSGDSAHGTSSGTSALTVS